MSSNRRKSVRRAIGYGAKIIAIDGSWTHDCRVVDVSDSGAKLTIQQQTEQRPDLPKDFILALSLDGKATRQCHVMWVKDNEIGVVFERRAEARSVA